MIGSGGAGLRAAVAVRKKHPNLNVVVVNKGIPSRNATCMAEGGINGVIDFENGDSNMLHAYDTVKGSDFLGDQDAIINFDKRLPKQFMSLITQECHLIDKKIKPSQDALLVVLNTNAVIMQLIKQAQL